MFVEAWMNAGRLFHTIEQLYVYCRYKSVGKLSSGHQAAIMKLAIDDTDTADGNICVVTGAKDHYVKVSPACCYLAL